MATRQVFTECQRLAARLTNRQWRELLDSMVADGGGAGVREWLAGGPDPTAAGAGPTLTSKEAGELLGVERQRLWRWEKAGRISRVATNNSGPLWLRVDVERLAAEGLERRTRATAGEADEE